MMKKHVKNAHMGTHLLAEVYNVTFDKLNDVKKIDYQSMSDIHELLNIANSCMINRNFISKTL